MSTLTFLARIFGSAICIVAATEVSAQHTRQVDPATAELFHHEMSANVGKILPEGIHVSDKAGHPIDIRKILHGPAILFKIKSGCKPCGEILEMLRDQASLANFNKASIAVLLVGYDGKEHLDLPEQVIELYSSDIMRTHGFLAGRITPTTFYFSSNLELIARKVGVPFSAKALLDFPVTSR